MFRYQKDLELQFFVFQKSCYGKMEESINFSCMCVEQQIEQE